MIEFTNGMLDAILLLCLLTLVLTGAEALYKLIKESK